MDIEDGANSSDPMQRYSYSGRQESSGGGPVGGDHRHHPETLELPMRKSESGSFDGLKKMFSGSRLSRRSTFTEEGMPFMRCVLSLNPSCFRFLPCSSKRPEDLLGRSGFSYSQFHDPDVLSIANYHSDDDDSDASDDDTKSVVSMSYRSAHRHSSLFTHTELELDGRVGSLAHSNSPPAKRYPFVPIIHVNPNASLPSGYDSSMIFDSSSPPSASLFPRRTDEETWIYRPKRSASLDLSVEPSSSLLSGGVGTAPESTLSVDFDAPGSSASASASLEKKVKEGKRYSPLRSAKAKPLLYFPFNDSPYHRFINIGSFQSLDTDPSVSVAPVSIQVSSPVQSTKVAALHQATLFLFPKILF